MGEKRIFYGWIIVAVSFLNLAVVFGIWYSFSVFLVAVAKDFGWQRAETSGVFSVFMVVQSLAAVIVGAFIDRLGPRIVFPAATVLVAGGLLLTSTINSLLEYYLWYGFLTPIGICAIGYIAHSIVLPRWFEKKRGLAIGIAMAGVGVGMQLLVPLAQHMINLWGWREAYRVLACFTFLALFFPNAFLQRRNPEAMGLTPDGGTPASEITATSPVRRHVTQPVAGTMGEAIRTLSFWFLVASSFFTSWAIQSTLIHQVAAVVEKGFSAARGAFFFGLAGIIGSIGKIGFGYLSDRLGREPAFALGMASAILGVLSLVLLCPQAPIFLYLYAILFGLGYGSIAPIFPARSADFFLGPDFGKIVGIFSLMGGMGGALGVWLSGKIFDLTGGYNVSLFVSIGCMMANVAFFSLAGKKARRLHSRG
ncbi:MAG: MFS transporter [Syntrophales bacterium]|nr:MFS transporter [Syntrophales bacterium]